MFPVGFLTKKLRKNQVVIVIETNENLSNVSFNRDVS